MCFKDIRFPEKIMSSQTLVEKLRSLVMKRSLETTQPKPSRSRTTSGNEPPNANEGDPRAILTLTPEIDFEPIPTPFNRSAYHTPICTAPATPALNHRGLVVRDIQLENSNPTRSVPDDVLTVRTAPNCAPPTEPTQTRPLAVSNHVFSNGRLDPYLSNQSSEEQILMQGSVPVINYKVYSRGNWNHLKNY